MVPAGLADLLREHATATGVPGAVLGVLCDGDVEIACHGVADVGSGRPVSPGTPFAAGSLTKSMVATVVARLVADGRLSLDDPVAAHVPELRTTPWAVAATVRSLLANRSGLPLRVAWEFDFERRPEQDAAALRRLVSHLATDTTSGGFWSYSNAGWCVLGRLVETLTGLAWDEAMRRHLRGLDQTSFDIVPPAGSAVGHVDGGTGPEPVLTVPSRAYAPAGTTTMSTAADLLRFSGWHLEDESLAGLREVQAEVPINGWLDAWCLGWARFDWSPHFAWGWDGLIDGQRSFLRLVPDLGAALALLTNSSMGRELYRRVVPGLLKEMLDIQVPQPHLEPSTGATGDLDRFAGLYAWPDRQVVVRSSDSCLLFEDEERTVEAWPVDERAFLVDPTDADNPTVTFGAFDDAGRPGVLYEMLWGLPRVTG